MGKKLLVLILDAFSDKYLKFAPYLSELCREYYCSTLKPIFAYEGIRTAILTGLDVQASGIWHDKIFIPKGRKDLKVKALKPLIALADRISPTDYVNKVLRFLLYKIFREDYGTPHLIPAKYLKYFITYRHENNNIPDLFQILSKRGIKSIWMEPKLNSLERKTLKKIVDLFNRYDLVIVKLNSLDRLGHKHGPLSNEVMQRVEYLDTIIEESMSSLQHKVKNISFIVMSDHGMTPVKRSLNVEELLKKETRVRPIKDYIPYIGSTFAAFYIINNNAKDVIYELLSNIEDYGKTLNEDEVKTLGINQELYGHIIFALNEGVVFFPSFFQRREIPKGMHGYVYSQYDNAILIAINISSKYLSYKSLKYCDIFKILVDFWSCQS